MATQPQNNPKDVVYRNPLTGNQEYAANMKGGVLLKSGVKLYQNLFAVSTSTGGDYDKVISNLDNPGKMNDSEGFTAFQYGLRIIPLFDGAMTPAQSAAAAKMLLNCRIQLFIGANRTRVLDIEGAHFMNTESGIVSDSSAANNVAVAASLPNNATGWLVLPQELRQEFKQNMNFSASLECELPEGTPAALGYDDTTPRFAFVFLMGGRRIVIGG